MTNNEVKFNYITYVVRDEKIKNAILDSINNSQVNLIGDFKRENVDYNRFKHVILELEDVDLVEVFVNKFHDISDTEMRKNKYMSAWRHDVAGIDDN